MRRPIHGTNDLPTSGFATNGEIAWPSLARARELGLIAEKRGWFGTTNLLESEPRSDRVTLALVVRALVQTRSFHDREDELGTGLVNRLMEASSYVPSSRFQPSSWQCVSALHDARPRRCGTCRLRPGREMCQVCAGEGRIQRQEDDRSLFCRACERTGWITCTRCDGGGEVQRVTVRTFQDRVGELEHVFVPAITPTLHEALSERLLGQDQLPAELRVDLDHASVKLGDYRGDAADSRPHFHRIDASQVLPDAKATLTRMAGTGTLVERVVEAHAVPLLLLDYAGWTVALVSLGDRMYAAAAEAD